VAFRKADALQDLVGVTLANAPRANRLPRLLDFLPALSLPWSLEPRVDRRGHQRVVVERRA